MFKRRFFSIVGIFVGGGVVFISFCGFTFKFFQKREAQQIKLYWFIPDGVRAEPNTFTIYKWAQEGLLPNIKKMMDNGTYGYCKPVYPGHTPVNFATLFTGAYPEVHGVSDGPMHEEGRSLSVVSVGGFSSAAKKVDPIWVTLENFGKKVALLSIPGSTPPELTKGYTMVGRWGGWGAAFYPVNFEDLADGKMNFELGTSKRLFFNGPPLVIFGKSVKTKTYPSEITTYSPPKKVELKAWGKTIYAYIYDSTDDNVLNYNRIAFSFDEENIFVALAKGEWSNWLPIKLTWKNGATGVSVDVETSFKIKVIKLEQDGFYKIRFYYNSINEILTEPKYLAEEMIKNVGPMVDFADQFPPQLIYYPEDKEAFIEEANMSFEWHKKAVSYFLKSHNPDIFIHDIYTPNQMLTSRWWLGYIDPESPRYDEVTEPERKKLWDEVLDMYKKLDEIVGVYLENADDNTIVVLSSDHGAAPLHTYVHLNNLFATKGWLKFVLDKRTGEPIVDWINSKVVYLQFGNIYINPEGLHNVAGVWQRASGPEYEKLRAEVAAVLEELKDSSGVKILTEISTWEEVENKFHLPHERCGDLIIANRPGYEWYEEMTEDRRIFSKSLITGYKQSIISDNTPSMWTPFIIMGPGVKKNNFLGDKPFSMIHQYPTIMKLLKKRIPDFVQGSPIKGVFEK